jgi:hypothetical protein
MLDIIFVFIVFVKFIHDILGADPASKILYNFKLN